ISISSEWAPKHNTRRAPPRGNGIILRFDVSYFVSVAVFLPCHTLFRPTESSESRKAQSCRLGIVGELQELRSAVEYSPVDGLNLLCDHACYFKRGGSSGRRRVAHMHTWTVDEPFTIRKSSTNPPSERKAWALTPASIGTRSSFLISGISFCRLFTKARL